MALTRAERERLIAQYAAGPTRLRAALATVPAEAMTWRPAPAEWSAHEIVCHCADSETNSYARIRFLLAEPKPVARRAMSYADNFAFNRRGAWTH